MTGWSPLLVFVFSILNQSFAHSDEDIPHALYGDQHAHDLEYKNREDNCWVTLNAKRHFEIMDGIDEKYADARKEFNKALKSEHFDDTMKKEMIKARAAAERAIFHMGHKSLIPAGINFGGYELLPMPKSLLFFQRMKLRNQTYFHVRYLDSSMETMVLIGNIALNDLHLRGTYMRAAIDRDPSHIIYRPAFGEIELLLKNVEYKIEGRYRFVQDRLAVEHIASTMRISEILITYVNGSDEYAKPERVPEEAIAVFKQRVQADLDTWLKDYFNDYLLQKDLKSITTPDLVKYEEEKTLALNEYVDLSVHALKNRLYSLKPPAADVRVPDFTIHSVNGITIKLHTGVVRGMDSFYRKSVATGAIEDRVRKVDAVLAFQRLKLEYRYEARIPNVPILYGIIILAADELVAQLSMRLVKEPETADIEIRFSRGSSQETLVVGGSLNRQIANFKYILEEPLMSLMLNKLWFQIQLLGTLTSCQPRLIGFVDDGEKSDEIKEHGKIGKTYPIKVFRNDSIELQLPNEGPADAKKKLHIKYQEQLNIDETDISEEKGDVSENKIKKPKSDTRRKRSKSKHHKKHKHGRKGKKHNH